MKRKKNSQSAIISVIFLFLSLMFSGCSGSSDGYGVITLRLVNSNGNITDKISSVSSGYLIATLTDAMGNLLPGKIIRFTTKTWATTGGLPLHVELSPTTAITDSNGEAQVRLSGGSESGAGEARAFFDEYSSALNFTVEKKQDITIIFRLLKADIEGTYKETHQISLASPGKLEATLTYSDNKPVADQEVSFTTTLGYTDPVSGIAVTDKNGKAEVRLLSGLMPGEGEAVLTFRDYKISLKFAVLREDISVSLMLVSKQSWQVSPNEPDKWEKANTIREADSPACLIATLKDVNGNPAPNKVVRFNSTLGRILPIAGNTQSDQAGDKETALTDKNGHAVMYLYAGSHAGAGEATADIEDYPPAAVGFTTLGDQSAFLSLKLIDAEGKEINTVSREVPGRLIAALTYGTNNIAIPNERITFTATLGLIQPKAGTALTDNKGQAVVDLLAGSAQGAGEAIAVFGNYSAKLAFQTQGDSTANMFLELSDEQTGKAVKSLQADSVGRLDIFLRDAQGNIIPDELLELSSEANLITIQPNSVLTDKDGRASVPVFAGTTSGNETILVKFQTTTAKLAFAVVKQKSPILTLQMTDAEGNIIKSMPANSSRSLTVLLTDPDKNPIPHQSVKFSATIGTVQASSAFTDNEGKAKVLISAGPTPGDGKAKAEYGDYSVEWEFKITGNEVNISLKLYDDAGTVLNKLKTGASGRLEALLTDSAGTPMVNKLVTFSGTDKLVGIFSGGSLSGTALTDNDGKASVTVIAGSDAGNGEASAKHESFSAIWIIAIFSETPPDTPPDTPSET